MIVARVVFSFFIIVVGTRTNAASLASVDLEREFARITQGFEGRVGVCALSGQTKACLNGDRYFSLQSVMKLIAGMAVMDAVDQRGWKWDEPITFRKQDLSLFVQPIADIVKKEGSFKTATGDLVRRAIVDSDSAATDMLIQKLGGPKSVQAFLDRRAVRNVRVDRDEKHLQTEILGLMWKPEYVDADALTRATNALPEDVRDAAFKRYQTDVRDTATPLGMATLLQSLASNTLLSPASSKRLIDVMKQTVTYPGRLKAGTAPGWTIAHKTGTSGTWKGVTVAVNDVGILGAPDGGTIAIAVFLGDSRASEEARDALIAKLAAAAIDHYR